MLLSLAKICDIDIRLDDIESNNILAQLRPLDASKIAVESTTGN